VPKLPCVKPKQVIKALKKADFIVVRITGSHHILYKKDCSPITVPFHNKDLKKGTLFAIIKQSKLPVKRFIDLL